MNASQDPTYLRLYHEFLQAAVAFDNAVRNRQRARDSLRARRAAAATPRRPVGAPPIGVSPAPAAANVPPRGAPVRERYFDMGPILGRVRLSASTAAVREAHDPIEDFDVERLYDQISLGLYWNAKVRYERAKRAFFDHVHRENRGFHQREAVNVLSDAARLQWLGVDSGAESELEKARRHIESACQDAWRLYETSPSPKSREVTVLLLESLAEAQLIGVDDRPIGKTMAEEVNRLLGSGTLSRG